MLAAKDLDLVLIAPPDHWHALIMIEAVKAGLDVWVQKPISADVSEGRAMVEAAHKYNRVVQVGLQRRSTPHIVEARDRFIREGKLGKIALVEIYCYYHMRATENPPDISPPPYFDYEMWTGPAPMQPYNALIHPRKWRAFMQYGNGIVGDMAVHMLDMTRFMLDLGWPTRIASTGGILVDKRVRRTSPIRKPQHSILTTCGWFGSTARGARRPIPSIPGALLSMGTKGRSKSVFIVTTSSRRAAANRFTKT